MQITSLGEPRAKIGEINLAEFVVWRDGQFERSTFQMVDENFEIVGLDESVFRSVAKEIVGVPNDELIERRRRSYQHSAGTSAAASSASGALPGRGDSAGVSGHDNGIEGADVDAQFERARRNHTAYFSIAQASFDFAPFVRQVAATVAANGFRFSGELRIRLLQISQKDFGVQTRIGEDHRLQIAFQEFLRHARRFVYIAAADAQRAIHNRRIVENEGFLRGGRAVRIEDFDLGFEKACSKVAGVGDGCGAADELRIAAVKTGDAAKPAEDITQMAAEDAAIGVQFIEDNVAQVFEQPGPAGVVREDAGVQHVRIGQDDVAFFANGFTGVGGGVAVIGENAEAIVEVLVEVMEFGELVLREGFGGEEVHRSGIRIFERRV